MSSIKLEISVSGLDDDLLVQDWCRAMERKLTRLLEKSFQEIEEEVRAKRELGASGSWHVLRAQHKGMK